MKVEHDGELKARRVRPLISTGRSNERVLCGQSGCGAQIGWVEQAGAEPLVYREGERVFTYTGPAVPFPERYEYMTFRPGYAPINGVWQLAPAARIAVSRRRLSIDRTGIGDPSKVGASAITPSKVPAWVECSSCRAKQVLDEQTLGVHVLKRQRYL